MVVLFYFEPMHIFVILALTRRGKGCLTSAKILPLIFIAYKVPQTVIIFLLRLKLSMSVVDVDVFCRVSKVFVSALTDGIIAGEIVNLEIHIESYEKNMHSLLGNHSQQSRHRVIVDFSEAVK